MYAKIFSQIYDGTLCTNGPWEALVTFQQLLILADQEGAVDMTIPAIARRTTIPKEIIERGVVALMEPDPDSRTPTEEGRRLVPLAEGRTWGWRIVNYVKYRQIKREEDRREYHREYWHKRKLKDSTETQQPQPSQPIAYAYAYAEAEAEAEAEEKKYRGASESVGAPRKRSANTTGSRLPAEWILTRELGDWAMQDCGMTREAVKEEAEKFSDYWHGVAGAKGRKVDWSATWRNWCRNAKPAQAGAHASESFRERDQRLAAERVRDATGGLCHDRKATGERPRAPLPFERGYTAPTTETIEGEANEQLRLS